MLKNTKKKSKKHKKKFKIQKNGIGNCICMKKRAMMSLIAVDYDVAVEG